MATQLNVTEWMRGHVGFGATDYAAGEQDGIAKHTRFEHEVLIQMADIERFVDEPKHSARMDGHVVWDGHKLPFKAGEFNMLVDSTDKRMKHMFYRIPFEDSGGKPMTMLGHKSLTDDAGLDLPGDITTLFVRIYDGHVPGHDFSRTNGPVPEWPAGERAMGIIHISLRDGIKSAMSFAAPGSGWFKKQAAVLKFVKFYGGRVLELYVKQSRVKLLVIGGVIAVALGGLALLLAQR